MNFKHIISSYFHDFLSSLSFKSRIFWLYKLNSLAIRNPKINILAIGLKRYHELMLSISWLILTGVYHPPRLINAVEPINMFLLIKIYLFHYSYVCWVIKKFIQCDLPILLKKVLFFVSFLKILSKNDIRTNLEFYDIF